MMDQGNNTGSPTAEKVTPASESAEGYYLSYVNEPKHTFYYDRCFSSLADLEAWVKSYHPKRTSYQVIVVR